MKRFLPVLSESLKTILVNVKNDYPYDGICKEILRVNKLMQFYLDNKADVPEICPIFEEELDKALTDEVIMLSGRYGEEFEISFLPADKEPEYNSDGKWARRNRQTGKPGRIFQKLLKTEFKQRDWEIFINRFKATMCCSTNFEIVDGEQITYWYNSDHYFRCSGTLGNSCMKYENCEDFFKIYEDNAKMLITTKDGLLTGRAIVWELPDGKVLLDRIYTCFDYLENCFIEYAKDHKWWFRENNSLLNNGDDQYWYSPDDDYQSAVHPEFRVKLKGHYHCFPYVDSFRYFNGVDTISTHPVFNIYLSCTDGTYESSEDEWYCDSCGETFHSYDDEMPEELHHSDYDDADYCDNCCWWSDGLEDYISNAHSRVIVHTNGTEFEYPDSWVEWRSDKFTLVDDEYYDNNEFDFKYAPNVVTGNLEIVEVIEK